MVALDIRGGATSHFPRLKRREWDLKPLRYRKHIACLPIVLVAGLASGAVLPAQAQSNNAGRGVIVDMSVLNELGAGPGRMPGTATGPGGLLMPGNAPPQSMLHVPPPKNGAAIPSTAQKTAAPRQAPVRAPTPPKVQQASTPSVAPATAPRAPAAPAPKLPEVSLPSAPTAAPPAAPKPVEAPAAKPTPAPARTASAPASAPKPAPAPAPSTSTSAFRPMQAGAPSSAPVPAVSSSVAPPPAPPPVPPSAPAAETAESTQVASAFAPQRPVALTPPVATPAAVTPTASAAIAAVKAGQPLKVVFTEESARLETEWRAPLDAVIRELAANDNLRLRLLAYAGGSDMPVSKARRLSLSRALAVRSYLIENGVRNTRIDVQALGNKAEGEPLNRVDVSVVER
jgi:outer membrane protein OmpA-like peptidoglycan-associated protein